MGPLGNVLIAAAHAGCFSMALSGDLGRAGFEPETVDTEAKVTMAGRPNAWQTSSAISASPT